MTQSEIDALRAQIERCWVIPTGWTHPREVVGTDPLPAQPDGTVDGTPEVVEFPASQYGQVAADNAIRAVLRAVPIQLPAEKYDQWSEVQLRFTPPGLRHGSHADGNECMRMTQRHDASGADRFARVEVAGGARAVFAVCVAGVAIRPAAALLELDITRGNIQPLPIAIPAFAAPAATRSSAPTSPR